MKAPSGQRGFSYGELTPEVQRILKEKPRTAVEVAKALGITREEVICPICWLHKKGCLKVVGYRTNYKRPARVYALVREYVMKRQPRKAKEPVRVAERREHRGYRWNESLDNGDSWGGGLLPV